MLQKRVYHLLFILTFFLVGCNCSKSSSATKIAKINLANEPHTLDPRRARDNSSQALMRMFFEGLTRIGPKDEAELALATSVEVSADLKTYVFKLRPSQWSNKDPVKASDFVYSWRKTLSPDFPADNAYQLYLLKNGKAVKEGKVPVEELGVVAVDDLTLLVELEHPTPYLLEILAAPIFFPVNSRIDQAKPHWAEKCETYVSNGPFCFKKWVHQDLIVAEKNKLYWDEKNVRIQGIEMVMVQSDTELKLFEKKELHWAGSPLSTLSVDALQALKQTGHLHVKPISGTSFIRVNTEVGPLKNLKVRRALALAIDRKAIVEHVTQGGQIPAMGLVPPSMGLQMNPYFADGAKEEAQTLFAEALKELKIKRADFPKITFTYAANERNHLIAQAIQQQWNEVLKIPVGLESIERSVYFDRVSKQDFQMALGSWLADFNDPVNFLEVFKYKSKSTNNTQWEDANYSQMLDDSFRLQDARERYSLLEKCEDVLMQAMPIIPIFYYTMVYVKDDQMQGVFLSSLGNLDFKWASLENEKR